MSHERRPISPVVGGLITGSRGIAAPSYIRGVAVSAGAVAGATLPKVKPDIGPA
jgi:hypothetical protein